MPVFQADANVHSATLSWSNVTQAGSYNLVVSSSRDCDFKNYASCPDGMLIINVTSQYRVTGLRNAVPYYFLIESMYTNGARGVSKEAGARPNPLSFDRSVNAIAPGPASTLYLGGEFTFVGATTGNSVPVDATTGRAISPDFQIVNGFVSDITSDGTGGWYIVGSFSDVSAVPRSNMAHTRADGTVDPNWSPSADNAVSAVAVSGDTIYIGGNFTAIAGTARNRLAAINSSGTLLSWDPNANGTVRALAISGNAVHIGGSFTTIGGVERNRFASIDTSGVLFPANPNVDSGNIIAVVSSLARSCNAVYLGGHFEKVGGATRTNLAALSMDGVLLPWNPRADSTVYAVAAQGGIVYVGGTFTSVNGAARGRFAMLNARTGEIIP